MEMESGMKPLISLLLASTLAFPAFAQTETALPGGAGLELLRQTDRASRLPPLYPWMSSEIADAWRAGYQGKGVTVTVVDDFSSGDRFGGQLGSGYQYQTHGGWTALESKLVAPKASIKRHDFYTGAAVQLARKGLNVLNLSYGMYAPSGWDPAYMSWDPQESSIISYAFNGSAIVVKAAGNDSVAVNGSSEGYSDYLNLSLIGGTSVLFVGALNSNGRVDSPATLADYSNYAGSDPNVQKSYLVVGVEGDKTGLYGTSFAAPIISGYAAILGSKFKKATPSDIVNQLLITARKDTVENYNPERYGQGEASISRALAPLSIK